MSTMKPSENFQNLIRKITIANFGHIVVSFLCLGVVLYDHITFQQNMEGQAYFVTQNGAALARLTNYHNPEERYFEIESQVKLWTGYMFHFDQNNFYKQIEKGKEIGQPSDEIAATYSRQKLYELMVASAGSSRIEIDSLAIDSRNEPYVAKLWAKRVLKSDAGETAYFLNADLLLENVSRSENNPHGLIITAFKPFNQSKIR